MFDLAQHLATNVLISPDLTFHLSAIAPDTSINFGHFSIADWHSSINMHLFAQQFNQNVMADLGKGWDNFVRTGQIWALLIGMIVGYLFKSITSF
jgi:hypothetical protein